MLDKIIHLENKKSLLFVLFSAILFLDQTVKFKIRQSGGFFVCNNGISFGIKITHLNFWLTLGFLFLLILFIFLLYKRKINPTASVGFTLLLAGSFSNIIDRFKLSCVMDYLSPVGNLFPSFNLADSFIFLGTLILFYQFLLFKNQKGD